MIIIASIFINIITINKISKSVNDFSITIKDFAIINENKTLESKIIQNIADYLNPNSYFFNFLTFTFVIFFAFFYASITFNAKDISDNLKRQGGFIPGIRTGNATMEFLNETASRLTFTGALYLGLVATLPFMIIKGLGVPFFFGGTAVLIVVQVALDTMRKIEAQQYSNKYNTLSAVGL